MKQIHYKHLLSYVVHFFACFVCTVSAAQTTIIEGTVVKSGTNEPVIGAHIIISGSSDGASSDSDGWFKFSTQLVGKQQIDVSFIGFETIKRDITIKENDARLKIHFELTLEDIELEGILIETNNSEWNELYKIFTREFIGTNSFADETSIENKWVIDFVKNPQREFFARAIEPIIVRNNALGYLKTVTLKDFYWRLNKDIGHFFFDVKFEYLEPDDDSERVKWDKNRRLAYIGSFTHFLESLFADELNINNFEVVSFKETNPAKINEAPKDHNLRQELIRNRILFTELNKSVKAFHINGPVDILHGKRSSYSFRDNRKRARITPQTPARIFFVRKDGTLVNPKMLSVEGYWKLERMANVLPSYYRPD